MYASNFQSYIHLILALGIVREPTVWVFITSQYPGIHDIGLPNIKRSLAAREDGHHADSVRLDTETMDTLREASNRVQSSGRAASCTGPMT